LIYQKVFFIFAKIKLNLSMKINKINFKITTILVILLIFLVADLSVYSQSVGIGGNLFAPDPSSMLEVQSTQKGVLFPRMTTAQRDSISNGDYGYNAELSLLIYNTTTNCFEFYAYDAWHEFGCANIFSCGESVTDADGNAYATVQIGTQCWFKENLKTTKYNDNTSIYNPSDNADWLSESDPATGQGCYSWYDDNEGVYKNLYGALYNWNAAVSGKLCPEGWRVPTYYDDDQDVSTLWNYLADNGYNYDGSTGGGQNKIGKSMASSSGWTVSATTGAIGNTDYPAYRNKSEFTGLPGGWRDWNTGAFQYKEDRGYWWSSHSAFEQGFSLQYGNTTVTAIGATAKNGFSVRCIKE
jgi:uncharacterized protein (TIGR02145 family)